MAKANNSLLGPGQAWIRFQLDGPSPVSIGKALPNNSYRTWSLHAAKDGDVPVEVQVIAGVAWDLPYTSAPDCISCELPSICRKIRPHS